MSDTESRQNEAEMLKQVKYYRFFHSRYPIKSGKLQLNVVSSKWKKYNKMIIIKSKNVFIFPKQGIKNIGTIIKRLSIDTYCRLWGDE